MFHYFGVVFDTAVETIYVKYDNGDYNELVDIVSQLSFVLSEKDVMTDVGNENRRQHLKIVDKTIQQLMPVEHWFRTCEKDKNQIKEQVGLAGVFVKQRVSHNQKEQVSEKIEYAA